MQQIIYVVFDLAAEAIFGAVILQSHDAAAIRLFKDLVQDPNIWGGSINKHPTDYELRELGLLTAECRIIPNPNNFRTVVTGAAILATMTPQLIREASPEGA